MLETYRYLYNDVYNSPMKVIKMSVFNTGDDCVVENV